MYSKIVGTGSYLPTNVVTNADLEKTVDTTDQWIVDRTGIHQRHIADEGQTTVDLAFEAAKKAIESADIENSDIDLIIVATTTPDLIFPSTACLLQEKLDIHGCPAFDIQAVCTGFVYALSIADKFIKTGASKCALIIGAETLSRILNWEDRTTCVLFGDGAGAVVLKSSDNAGILSTHIHADGQYKDLLSVNAGVSQNSKLFQNAEAYIQMKGSEVFKTAVRTLGAIVDETLNANGMDKAEVDWLVPHQANIRIISATAKKLKMPMEKVITTVGLHGNTSAASIPLAYDVAVRDGRIKPGEIVLMEAFGGGFTWGSVLFKA